MDSLYILDSNGQLTRNVCTSGVIIEKPLRSPMDRSVVDLFRETVQRQIGGQAQLPAVLRLERHTFVHLMRDALTYLAIVDHEVSPMLVLEFLGQLAFTLNDYFGDVTDVIVKDNFVTVYTLLEEMLDHGFPLMTEPNVLKEMVPPPTVYQRVLSTVANVTNVSSGAADRSPGGSISNLPWRKADVRYTNNEVYFDLSESIDAIVDRKGRVITAEIYGRVDCNCKLSGMPDLTLSFSNPSLLEDGSFHHCVRYPMFKSERVVSLVPPDGRFQLLTYCTRLMPHHQPLPIVVTPRLYISPDDREESRLDVSMAVGHSGGRAVEDVRLTVPLPQLVSNVHVSTSCGHVRFEPSSRTIHWEAGRVSGLQRVPSLSATFICPKDVPRSGYTAQLDFRVDGFVPTGLRVNSLLVHGESYAPYKGLRSQTRAGNYQIRM